MKWREIPISDRMRVVPARLFNLGDESEPSAYGADASIYIVGALGISAALHVYDREFSHGMTVHSVDSYKEKTAKVSSLATCMEPMTFESVQWVWKVNPILLTGLLMFSRDKVNPYTVAPAVFANYDGKNSFDEFKKSAMYRFNRIVNYDHYNLCHLTNTNVQPVLLNPHHGILVITDILNSVTQRQRSTCAFSWLTRR